MAVTNGLSKMARALRDPSYCRAVLGRRVARVRDAWNKCREIAPPPGNVTLFLTNSCNLRCRMCAQYGESGTSRSIVKDAPPTELIFRTIEELAPYQTHFTLMGGEPTLNREWPSIARKIKSHRLYCDIITNGTLLEKDAETMLDCGLDQVNLSVDGVGPVNDEIRGKGVFDKIERGLNRLIDLKRERNSETPRINLFFTLNAPNHDRLVPFLEWASGKAIQAVTVFHLRFYHEQDYRDHNEFMKNHLGGGASLQSGFVFQPGPIDTGALCEQIETARSRQWPFHLAFQPDHPPDEIPDYYYRVGYRRRAITYCGVPWTCAAIDPSANVIPCIDYVCGNLKEKSFLKIWNGKKFRLFRKVFRKQGRAPLCHRCCV